MYFFVLSVYQDAVVSWNHVSSDTKLFFFSFFPSFLFLLFVEKRNKSRKKGFIPSIFPFYIKNISGIPSMYACPFSLVVEHQSCKLEVMSSILIMGFFFFLGKVYRKKKQQTQKNGFISRIKKSRMRKMGRKEIKTCTQV